MRLAYIDESGDSGYDGSRTYTLGCVLVDAVQWPQAFEDFIGFRRFLRRNFGILVRAELKANFLLRGSGTIKLLNLGDKIRHDIYRQHMRFASKAGLDVFVVVIRKDKIYKRTQNPRDVAWEYLIQRLVRKARRINMPGSAFGTGRLSTPARLIIDDPVPRDSRQSYFIQLADLAAYAAFRAVVPPPSRAQSVCPSTMWDELGAARYEPAVGQGWTGHVGIVQWP